MGPKNDDFRICEEHLGRVSRTFAVNMRVLRGDAYRGLLLAYLLCRIADTIEDEPSLAVDEKTAALAAYGDLFPPGPDWSGRVSRFLGSFTFPGSGAEAELFFDTPRVFREFVRLPAFSVAVVSERVREMARGMAAFQEKGADGGLAVLADQEELERYCYYVAGTVGLMITDLFFGDASARRGLPEGVLHDLTQRSVPFGLGLQMTNIAKDFVGDSRRGWCYVPRSFFTDEGLEPVPDGTLPPDLAGGVLDRLIELARGYLDEALVYVISIPRRYVRYRLFCLLPLLMAVETLVLVESAKDRLFQGLPVKISRKDVGRIVRNASWAVLSNRSIRSLYESAWRRAAGATA